MKKVFEKVVNAASLVLQSAAYLLSAIKNITLQNRLKTNHDNNRGSKDNTR